MTLLFCGLYSIMRFTVEIFRDDNPLLFDGMTISQNVSILVLVVIVALFVIGRIRLKGQTKALLVAYSARVTNMLSLFCKLFKFWRL